MSTMTNEEIIAWAREHVDAATRAGAPRLAEKWRRLADLAEKGASGWQPIATAPEETDVLVWDADMTFAMVGFRRGERWHGTSRMLRPRKPTHWRPLPAPPEGT